MRIIEVSPEDARLRRLFAVHKAYSRAHTPGGGGHAVASGADLSGYRYWIVLDAADVLGCVGMKPITPSHMELKSMHVREEARGRGLGGRLVGTLLAAAREAGYARVSLETHPGEGFAASRRLYARHGFEPCEPFGHYTDDSASYCMTLCLQGFT